MVLKGLLSWGKLYPLLSSCPQIHLFYQRRQLGRSSMNYCDPCKCFQSPSSPPWAMKWLHNFLRDWSEVDWLVLLIIFEDNFNICLSPVIGNLLWFLWPFNGYRKWTLLWNWLILLAHSDADNLVPWTRMCWVYKIQGSWHGGFFELLKEGFILALTLSAGW